MTPRGKNSKVMLLLNYLSFMLISSFFAAFVVKGKFDKIFVYQPSPIFVGIPAIVLKYLKGIPLYFWVTDLWPESVAATINVKSKFIMGALGKVVKFIYEHSDKVLVSSKGFVEHIMDQGIPAEKIVYWPQWGEDFFRQRDFSLEDAKKLELPNGFKIMFAGNIGNAQSFETIVDAADKLKNHTNIHWVVLGDGLKRNWVQREVKARGLEKTFHLMGPFPFEMMPLFYSQADALLFSLKRQPLFSLTLPGKVQTYLASAKPIIASIDGEGANLVNEAQSGISCPAEDAGALAQAVLKLSNMTERERESMGEKALVYFDQNFRRDRLLLQLESIMQ
jgi:glycosyltransferase involved in cell wall biosynthesis